MLAPLAGLFDLQQIKQVPIRNVGTAKKAGCYNWMNRCCDCPADLPVA